MKKNQGILSLYDTRERKESKAEGSGRGRGSLT